MTQRASAPPPFGRRGMPAAGPAIPAAPPAGRRTEPSTGLPGRDPGSARRLFRSFDCAVVAGVFTIVTVSAGGHVVLADRLGLDPVVAAMAIAAAAYLVAVLVLRSRRSRESTGDGGGSFGGDRGRTDDCDGDGGSDGGGGD
jgi:uncharacterized membrane protein YgcG